MSSLPTLQRILEDEHEAGTSDTAEKVATSPAPWSRPWKMRR